MEYARETGSVDQLINKPSALPIPAHLISVTERQSRLSAQQLKDLSEELAALMKKQSDARLTEVFFRMSDKEIVDFDLRTQRISKIHVLLSDHDGNR